MHMAEVDDFRNLIFAMATAYGKELDDLRFEGYWLALGDLPLKRIGPAVEELMRTSKFLPTAAELRESIVENMTREEREAKIAQRQREHAAAMALDLVESCRRLGYDDEKIESELARVGQETGYELAWPESVQRQGLLAESIERITQEPTT